MHASTRAAAVAEPSPEPVAAVPNERKKSVKQIKADDKARAAQLAAAEPTQR